MKTETLWITSNANELPGSKGYTVHVIDPDPGIDNDRRTIASGFGVPLPVIVPDNFEIIASKYDEDFAWIGETPLSLCWHGNRGIVSAWPAHTSPPDNFADRWIFKSIKISDMPFFANA